MGATLHWEGLGGCAKGMLAQDLDRGTDDSLGPGWAETIWIEAVFILSNHGHGGRGNAAGLSTSLSIIFPFPQYGQILGSTPVIRSSKSCQGILCFF